MPRLKDKNMDRRQFLKTSGAVMGSSVFLATTPFSLHAGESVVAEITQEECRGMTVYMGYPELCTPGNNIPYKAGRRINRKAEPTEFLW